MAKPPKAPPPFGRAFGNRFDAIDAGARSSSDKPDPGRQLAAAPASACVDPPGPSAPPAPTAHANALAGYGRPPDAHKFRKGQSGNPKGRPRGARNTRPALNEERLKTIIIDEAYRTLKVTGKGKPVTLTIAQAVMRGIAHAAAKGQPRA